jgi:hypothetical protein
VLSNPLTDSVNGLLHSATAALTSQHRRGAGSGPFSMGAAGIGGAHRSYRVGLNLSHSLPAVAKIAYIRLRSKLIYLLVSCRAGKEEARSYWHHSTTTTHGGANDGSRVKPQWLA